LIEKSGWISWPLGQAHDLKKSLSFFLTRTGLEVQDESQGACEASKHEKHVPLWESGVEPDWRVEPVPPSAGLQHEQA
jgi:hypothetical protein